MNAAAPEEASPRRINNLKHFGKHRTVTPCPGGSLNRGAIISTIFMVLVRTFCSCLFLQSSFYRAVYLFFHGRIWPVALRALMLLTLKNR